VGCVEVGRDRSLTMGEQARTKTILVKPEHIITPLNFDFLESGSQKQRRKEKQKILSIY
jgi:hypothetical protein